MTQLSIQDLSFYHDNFLDVQSLEGGNGNLPFSFPIRLEPLTISIDVGVSSLVFIEFPNTAGTAFVAVAAVGVGQGASTGISWEINYSSNG